MSTQKVYPTYSFQYIQNKLVELSRQKLNSSDVTPQVQADWTETDTFSPAYIKNKPTLPGTIGDVTGPSSSVDGDVVLFDGTTGKLIKDSGVAFTDVMLKSIYDIDNTGVVDKAEGIAILGRNSTGSTLYKGSVVYISGSTGNRPNFTLAQANTEATSAGTFGMILADIPNNTDGYVMSAGYVDNLDTRTTAPHPITSVTLADGDKLYLDPNTAGYVTNVKPSAPNHLVYIGVVTRTSPTNGTIVLRIQNGYELEELHNVAITTPANNDIVTYDSATSLWKNKTLATILGYTPVPTTRTITINGTTLDLSANRSWSVGDLFSSGSYANPTWITSLAWSKITGTPTTISGYGITDAVPSTRTLTINGTAYDLSADRSWTISSGMTNPMTSVGDLILGTTAGAPSRLAIGTNGQVLTSNGTTASWQTPASGGMTNPMTTAGDIIYGGTGGTPTRLGIGTSGYFLQAGASAPAWFNLFGTANTWSAQQVFSASNGILFTYNGVGTNTHMQSYLNTNSNGNYSQYLSSNSANTVTYSAFRHLIAGSGNGFGMASLAVNQAATGTTLTPYLTADGQWQTVATFVKMQIGATASTNGILSSAAKSMLDVIGCIGTAVVAKTATYTATITDSTILCNATSGAITINLPTAVGIAGRFYTIKKTDSSANAITIDANGSQTIDGALTYTLMLQNKYVTIQTDGANWFVVANN